jgi:hypothetical protein
MVILIHAIIAGPWSKNTKKFRCTVCNCVTSAIGASTLAAMLGRHQASAGLLVLLRAAAAEEAHDLWCKLRPTPGGDASVRARGRGAGSLLEPSRVSLPPRVARSSAAIHCSILHPTDLTPPCSAGRACGSPWGGGGQVDTGCLCPAAARAGLPVPEFGGGGPVAFSVVRRPPPNPQSRPRVARRRQAAAGRACARLGAR